jgi:hypothetical protein
MMSYQTMSEQQQQREVRMFGATRSEVEATVDSYLAQNTAGQIIDRMLMSAWRELASGQPEDARQTLNRAKITIQRFYTGDPRDFFFEPAGEAYSMLSDVQHLIEFEDIIRAKVCIDEAAALAARQFN